MMTTLIPVFCSLPNSLTNLFLESKRLSFQGQRTQNFSSPLDQIEVSCILGLDHKQPALMVQAKQELICNSVHSQVVHNGIDLQIVWQPLIYFLEVDVFKLFDNPPEYCEFLIFWHNRIIKSN